MKIKLEYPERKISGLTVPSIPRLIEFEGTLNEFETLTNNFLVIGNLEIKKSKR